jgi:hypothetical protein
MVSERTYPVPARISSPLLGTAATMSDIDLLVEAGYGSAAERQWAIGVRSKFVSSRLDLVCENDVLPMGLVADAGDVDIVVALTDGPRVWRGEWMDAMPVHYDDVIQLTGEEIAFSVEALSAGAGLALHAACPLGFLSRAVTAAAEPSNMKIIAVVDRVDRDAVLELLAIAPGPIVFRRNDGKWERDNDWLRQLKGVKPPPIVALDDNAAAGIIAQVDASTKGKEFKPQQASGFDSRLHEISLEWWLRSAAPAPITAAMPAKLAKYWLFGAGASKIRWGTPGAWRRCHRQLSKYFDPYRAKGACTNLASRIGGHGIATHVGG